MRSIGLRCAADSFLYVVLQGALDAPELVDRGERKFPVGVSRPEGLRWLGREVESLIDEHKPDVLRFKPAELMRSVPTQARHAAEAYRAEAEGIAQAAAANKGFGSRIDPRLKKQIKSEIGYPGPASEVEKALREPPFDGLPRGAYADATLAALCGLA